MRETRAFPCIILWLSNFFCSYLVVAFPTKKVFHFPCCPGNDSVSVFEGKCFLVENGSAMALHLGFCIKN
uniref:Putative secreted peptide n=1 Tax=Anopheles braziliensis TaxID=58242 RepID=A0A2M3ZWT4_9DIPT